MENQKQKLVGKKTVQRLLIHLGIAPKTNGYGYLATAITLRLECRNAEMRMKELYARVAREFRVSAASVERCMRFAVGRAYNVNRLDGINNLYKARIINEVPMLSDFIMYIVEYFDSFYRCDDYMIG